MIKDTTMTAAQIMGAHDIGDRIEARYKPMRGQAYVQRIQSRSSLILDPGEDERERPDNKLHRGRVIALGLPGRKGDLDGSPELPWDIQVGDEIVFSLFAWLDKFRTMRFLGVEGDVMVVAQGEIHGVIESVHEPYDDMAEPEEPACP